jgi:NTE family protein
MALSVFTGVNSNVSGTPDPIIPVDSIKYIAFEGGGGKGLAYFGAIRVFERPDVKLLPLNTSNISGISGASAGAITAFFLSVGMKGDDILGRIKNNDFSNFWDSPIPGVYKAVFYNPNTQKNVVGYTCDKILTSEEQGLTQKKTVLDGIVSGALFYKTLDEARAIGSANQKLLADKMNMLRVLKSGMDLFNVSKKVLKKSSEELVKVLTTTDGRADDKKTFDYLYSELMDRGLFTGAGIRTYLSKAMAKGLFDNYREPAQITGVFPDTSMITPERCEAVTFAELKKITGKDFVVTSTNLISESSKLFSAKHTPDFPVVDAVCMSMSIPGVFKPTFVNASVDLSKKPDDPYNLSYRGFYVDGGMMNNLPIHVWDEGPDQPMNPGVIGIRVSSGFDPADKTYADDADWRTYIDSDKELKKAGYTRIIRSNTSYDANGSLTVKTDVNNFISVFGGYGGDILSTLMTPSEVGQIRTASERARTVEFFSYDIGLLDFTPHDSLNTFVQKRAAAKLTERLGLK